MWSFSLEAGWSFDRLYARGRMWHVSGFSRTIKRILVAVVATSMLSVVVVATAPMERATAVSGGDFNPGIIITDSLFYDSGAMSETEIQSFLNAKIGTCTNGNCLNVLSTTVASRPPVTSSNTGNLVCTAFEGGTLSAAAIIYRAQVACGISAKVLLVTLQKEQSLVTSSAPSQSRLDRAMGMACPDTAPCAEYALGFGNQLYEGAKQLNFYKAGRFAKQPGSHAIGFHPNSACGSSVVNVQNYATAALYNYTPYQPNAASLANIGGVGDSCSSYGNRNFFVYYNNWFGPTDGLSGASPDTGTQVIVRDSAGKLWMYPGNGKGGWRSPTEIGQGWGGFSTITGVGDFDGDGHRDLLTVTEAGELWLYPTDGDLGWLTPKQLASGWSDKTAVFSAGDFNGDGFQDIMSRDADGFLWLHPGRVDGVIADAVRIGNGWGSMTAIFGAGDFDGDGKQDLLSRTSDGFLLLHRGNGRGGWLYPSQVGNGWAGFTSLTNPGDFNGDGTQDVLARDASGSMWLYPGNGRGSWLAPKKVGYGWGSMTAIVGPGSVAGKPFADRPGVGDLNADGARDVLAIDTAGSLWLYPGNGRGSWLAARKVATGWTDRTATFGVSDFNGDGVQDVLSRDTAGVLWMYSSDGNGGLTGPSQIGSGWETMTMVFGAGDVNGDRKPDVLARDGSGGLWLYPGDGNGGWLESKQVGWGWGGMTAIFSAGDFDGDGNQDIMARGAGGQLWLYSGTGASGWYLPVQIGQNWGGLTAMFSPGDFDGDLNTDILVRDARGDLSLFRGDGRGSWLAGSRIGWGWGGMSWIG